MIPGHQLTHARRLSVQPSHPGGMLSMRVSGPAYLIEPDPVAGPQSGKRSPND